MTMVMVMMLIFLFTGARVQRIDRWVIAGMVAAITVVILVTYVRF
jgi:hypothetical protein